MNILRILGLSPKKKEVNKIDFELNTLIVENAYSGRNQKPFSEQQLRQDMGWSNEESFATLGYLFSKDLIRKIYSVECNHCQHWNSFYTKKEMLNQKTCTLCFKKIDSSNDNYYSQYEFFPVFKREKVEPL